MATKKEEPSLVQPGEAADPPSPRPPGPEPSPSDQQRSRVGNKVFKSGPLFISSKGIGWTSWKKRWFILTQTSLVFFRSDPSAAPQKAGEVNLTLGGIDLNNSGSVVVKADKKLLTVLLGEGRDGRTFTLKAETSEDLYEWKAALETALAQAPNPAHATGQNGIFRNDQVEAFDGSKEQSKDKPAIRFKVTGTPILLALQDVDGGPTFLEKALRFVEEHGIKVEGILRQAADVDDVEQRIREYEQGKTEFSPEEDAHVIADCVKYVLRELPSSPVPASCCKALLEACRTDRANRVNAMRGAICETFPEPNRRLLQRILMMMQTVASHMTENRMSPSAVAACMAPLLLRPLLQGDCEIENDFDVGGDGSMQLLQAAAAANHAQAIVITLLEEYKTIFGEGSMSPDLYSDSEESGSEGEEATDDESYVDDEDDESYVDDEDYENDDASEGSEEYTDDDLENESSRTGSETESEDNDVDDEKDSGNSSQDSESLAGDDPKASQKLPSISIQVSLPEDDHARRSENSSQSNSVPGKETDESAGKSKDAETAFENKPTSDVPTSCTQKMTAVPNGPRRNHSRKRPTSWGRTSAKKNLSMESIDFDIEEEEDGIKRLEDTKADLQNRIAEEVKGNEILQARLEERKRTLHDLRLALEKDVARLHEQLQKEKDKRKALKAGLDTSQRPLSIPSTIDEKTKAELKEIAHAEADVNNLNQKVDELSVLLNQREQNFISMHDSSDQPQQISNQPKLKVKQKETEAAGSSLFGRSKSKEKREKQDRHMDGAENQNENEKKQEPLSVLSVRRSNSKSDRAAAGSAAETPPKASKKSSAKGEGANSSSALTKLSNRLNFLKERRTQIATELQNMRSGQGRSEKARGSETHQSDQNAEKRGTETSQASQNPDKGAEVEGQTPKNSEKFRKAESHNPDGGRRLEDQHSQPVLDRGRSESHGTYNTDKPPGLGSQPSTPSRTHSR